MLNKHPDVLSLSGFFNSLAGRAFPIRPLGGHQFWRLITARRMDVENLLHKGAKILEYRYLPHAGRFNLDTGIPSLLYLTLPLLTDDPDSLYLELGSVVQQWSSAPVVEHYRRLFQWLAGRLNRSVVVERSAQSMTSIGQLRAAFPNARFVHLYRDGPDCALSMSKHPVIRMQMLQAEAARAAGVPWVTEINQEQLARLPDNLAQIATGQYDLTALMSTEISLNWFGQVWSAQTCEGIVELAKMPDMMWASMSYDALLENPVREFSRLATFIGVETTPAWLHLIAVHVDESRGGTARRLNQVTLAGLRQACAAGTEAIRATAQQHPRPF